MLRPGNTTMALVLAGVAGCQGPCLPSYCDDESIIFDPVDAQLGDYAVGAFDDTVLSSRPRVGFLGVENAVRLKVTAWYPAADAAGADDFCYDGLAPGHVVHRPPGACDSPRPVVIYSHGSGGIRYLASYLMEHLASHGYVLAAPDHTYNTFFDADRSDDGFAHVRVRRPVDVRDTFDWLVQQSASEASPLFGCVAEADGYAVIGHSFGGYTALAVGGWELDPELRARENLGDDRVWAISTHASWDAGGALPPDDDTIDVPLLSIAGELDETTEWPDVYALHHSVDTSPSYLAALPTAGHYSFTPGACYVTEDGDGCGEGFIGGDEVTGLINRTTLLFLEQARGASDEPPTTVESPDLVWDPPAP